MIVEKWNETGRSPKVEKIETEFLVVGGGLAGVCSAISAARQGVKVVLVQDRPVLGGNASSEVRLWVLGATSHMGNNNRWAREGGVIDEILVENMYRNPEGNALILDTILLEMVLQEKNIRLLLNTSVFEATKSSPDKIDSVRAFCSQNSTMYDIHSRLFCDASGDGILGFCAGAAFRMGAELQEEFGEKFTPDESYGELLGHTIYFYSKDVGKPVKFVAPSYALKDINQIPRFRNISSDQKGCNFWWFEYGGRRDTIHETEEIKWELWKVVYGVWDYIKNSGKFPEAENLTLEWVGTIPGKRESRRFEGPYMLKQQDVVEQTHFEDAVSFGGWSLDLHPSDAIYSDRSPCNQWHSKGIYEIPYRCFYSKNIKNLYFAGRIISSSHVAFGSSRVMATCAHGGQAVGVAAAQCLEQGLSPHELTDQKQMNMLQERLNSMGQSIPMTVIEGEGNLLNKAALSVSSQLSLPSIFPSNKWRTLVFPAGQMLPMKKGILYEIEIPVKSEKAGQLRVELRRSEVATNHTPEIIVESHDFELKPGEQTIQLKLRSGFDEDQYGFICFFADETVSVRESDFRATGLLSVYRKENKAVSNYGRQDPPGDIGIDSFEFWTAERRPEGRNLALSITPEISCFECQNLQTGLIRPISQPYAWVASNEDKIAVLNIKWDTVVSFESITLFFDPDYDHPMESVQMGHPERCMPFCVRSYRIYNDKGELIYDKEENHQGMNQIKFESVQMTESLRIEFDKSLDDVPVSLFYIDIH